MNLPNVFFPAVIYVVLVHFSEVELIMRDMVHLDEGGEGGDGVPIACVRRAMLGMLYADKARFISTSKEGRARIISTNFNNCDQG